jgi:hypothetical protein
MTPKEKAFHLYFSFIRDVIADDDKAKKCALIAVDYILNSEPNKAYFIKGDWVTPKTFWNEVKHELNKL